MQNDKKQVSPKSHIHLKQNWNGNKALGQESPVVAAKGSIWKWWTIQEYFRIYIQYRSSSKVQFFVKLYNTVQDPLKLFTFRVVDLLLWTDLKLTEFKSYDWLRELLSFQ